MNAFELIYNSYDSYNKFHNITLTNGIVNNYGTTVPSGYGAIPYSQSFCDNKYSPKPWGRKIFTNNYSLYANAGHYYNEDIENIYSSATGIFTNSIIFVDIGGPISEGVSVNPYLFGPVSPSYDVEIRGIENFNTPSGCFNCESYNGDYRAYLSTTHNISPVQDFFDVSYKSIVPPYYSLGLYSPTNASLLNNPLALELSWICMPKFPRLGEDCNSGIENGFSTPIVMTLLGLSQTPMNGTRPGGFSSIDDEYSIFHRDFPGLDICLSISSVKPNTSAESCSNFVGFPSNNGHKFIFNKNYGHFNPIIDRSLNYNQKPHMFDDVWIDLPPMTNGKLYWGHRDISDHSCSGTPVFDADVTNSNHILGCDYSTATCRVKPYKGGNFAYNPAEASVSTVDKTYLSARNRNNITILPQTFLKNTFEIHLQNDNGSIYSSGPQFPTVYDFHFENTASDTGIILGCMDCDSFFSKNRQVGGYSYFQGLSVSTQIECGRAFANNSHASGYRADVVGISGVSFTNSTGYLFTSMYWDGVAVNPFTENNFANFGGSQYKNLNNDFVNICDHACDFGGIINLNENNNYCINSFKLDITEHYHASTGYFHGWSEAFLYTGFTINRYTLYYPFRFRKMICDDRNVISGSNPCTQIYHIDDNISKPWLSGIGIVDPFLPVLSGGWTYEVYNTYPNVVHYDELLNNADSLHSNPYSTIGCLSNGGLNVDNLINDITGICPNIESFDIIMTPAKGY